MTKIQNINIYDLHNSIISCRNPIRIFPALYTDKEFEDSLPRAIALSKLGGSHHNFLKGIRVSFDIIYPNYLSPELQRYNWIDIISSSSKMFRLAEMTENDCFNEYVTDEVKEIVSRLADEYNKDKSYNNFIKLVSNTPQGLELFMRVSTNYLQLKNVSQQRKRHKLKEDWGEICRMIEELPLFHQLIES